MNGLNAKQIENWSSLEACSSAYKAKWMASREWMIGELVRIDPNGVWTDADNRAQGYEPLRKADCVSALISYATDEPIQFGTVVRFASTNADENPHDIYIVIEMKGDRCDVVCVTTDLPLPPVLTVLVADLVHA